jgi:hypothetical protein
MSASVVNRLINAVEDDPDVYEAVSLLQGTKLTARAIRNAMLPVRVNDLADVKVISNAQYYQAFAALFPTSSTQGTTMSINSNTPVQNVTFIYGRDVSTLSKQELIDAIKRAKGDIRAFADAGVESTYIASEITKLNDAVTAMVALLDA